MKKQQGIRLRQAREAAGYKSAREAALTNRWAESSYRAHESGTRTIGQDDAERYARRYRALGARVSARSILFGFDDEDQSVPTTTDTVPILGFIGAGALVEPEYEQVPSDGLGTVTLPFQGPPGLIALEIRGESMLPRYDDGDVVVVWREQRRSVDSFVGEEAAVRLADGRRFLKTVRRGTRLGLYTLDSFNAKPIENVRIVWIGEIFTPVRSGQVTVTGRDRKR